MSKQLLHSHNSDVIVAALNHRAFAVVSSSSSDQTSQNTTVYELMAPSSKSSSTDAPKSDGNDKSGDKPNDDNEIQAVCCTKVGSCLWFAVSRGVKTLSLYSIPDAESNIEGGSEETTKLLYPSAIYNLPKRARSLAFTSVENLQVIVAGDLSGDAIAFPVPTDAPSSTCDENEEGDLSGDAIAFPVPTDAPSSTCDENKAVKAMSTPKRLLLGHTASMLTGLSVVSNDQQQQFILTADRDEKVRISYFPEVFVSSASGDGTSRLWDYQTCKEVGMLPVVIKKSDGGEMEEVDDEGKPTPEEKDEMEENEEEDDFDEDFDDEEEEESFDHHTVAVPLSVALHPDAKFAAVARDEIQSIDIHPIPPVAEKSSLSTSFQLSNFVSLHKKQTLECKSQPLAVRFASDSSVLVLAKEPEYLLHFGTTDGASFNDISQSSCLTKTLCKVAQSQNITMPATTLERNDYGECTLQKKEDRKELTAQQNTKGGLHWNDPGRKVTAKKAQARKRHRKKEQQKAEGEKETNEEASN
eukprot:CAMPEP_0113410814 /NCGR_PEP_ID=MMETSP0013_2-20120614/21912_1 /TAXON_ID=2843 ORGANISM="Skeletonema costatum, Strain 1716" /NCGR_SAMPLE_ID=MMETSP0013_2 /ASSEMBLY_ACC=CAM_ASM_000158 /LENGTH=525 /DNA_ID=CAMNT_0000297085 /DNA_START=58 /DNA_END=1636 /DNA_ORIENTATION=- /assembly_acc=CAM_ASM_000158